MVASGGNVKLADAGKPCEGRSLGRDAAEIADVGAAIGRSVAVERFAPETLVGQAEAVS